MPTRYLCRACNYRFTVRGDRVPKNCPACNSPDIIKDYDAETLLKEVEKELRS